jgi:hypothetical protein
MAKQQRKDELKFALVLLILAVIATALMLL